MESILENVMDLLSSINNVDLLWYLTEGEEVAHRVARWVAKVIRIGTGHLF